MTSIAPTMTDPVFADEDQGQAIAKLYTALPLHDQLELLQAAMAMTMTAGDPQG